jgi:hypothetical protein
LTSSSAVVSFFILLSVAAISTRAAFMTVAACSSSFLTSRGVLDVVELAADVGVSLVHELAQQREVELV